MKFGRIWLRKMPVVILLLSIILVAMSIMLPSTPMIVADSGLEIDSEYGLDSSNTMIFAANMVAVKPGAALWSQIYEVHSTDDAHAIAKCTDGGYVVAGSSYGLQGYPDYDFFLMKTNDTGQKEWVKGYGLAPEDRCSDVIQSSDGGFILVGYTKSFSEGGFDIWLLKTDSDGNELWNRTFGGAGGDYGNAVKEDASGNLTIAGTTSSFGAGGSDGWAIYTNSTGHEIWHRTLGDIYNDHIYDVVIASDGNLTFVGDTRRYDQSDHDLWIVKLDTHGTPLWDKIVGGDTGDYGNSIVETSTGEYAIAGVTSSYNGGSGFSDDVWLVRTDSTGDLAHS